MNKRRPSSLAPLRGAPEWSTQWRWVKPQGLVQLIA